MLVVVGLFCLRKKKKGRKEEKNKRTKEQKKSRSTNLLPVEWAVCAAVCAAAFAGV